MNSGLNMDKIRGLIKEALHEDIGTGDITTRAVVPASKIIKAEIIAKETGIIAGLPVAKEVFYSLDKKIKFKSLVKEGKKIKNGARIAIITGNAQAILAGERTALNFIQRISGIATETARCAEKVKALKTKILDTRKTPAGWRYLDKYAVRSGSGKNPRFGLYDMVLIKDNHIALSRGIKEAVRSARKKYPHKKIEVEVKNFKELRDALETKIDIVMLDNMELKKIARAIKIIKGRCKIEVSGNVSESLLPKLAKLGVDYISMGRLTHSPRALDLSLKVYGSRKKNY